jgi:hypothetical protein
MGTFKNKVEKFVAFLSLGENAFIRFTIILTILLSLIFFMESSPIIGIIKKNDHLSNTIFLIILSIPWTINIIVNYLNGSKQKFNKNYENYDIYSFDRKKFEKEVDKIISEKINLELPKDIDIETLEDRITRKVSNTLGIDIVEELEERFNENYADAMIENNLIPITRNIEIYKNTIQRNANVNLMLGIVGSAIAIFILSYELLNGTDYKTVQEFLIHFLPRVTLVVFIQLFAFFFLRLYKNNLEDAKYFQNELTNLTAKTTSIKIASLKKNDDLLFEIVRNLSNTERNFKLSKEESLQTIENKKINSESDKDIMAQLKDILSKFEINKTA